MTKSDNSSRIGAKEAFVRSKGSATSRELAAQFGVSVSTINRWKKADDWSGAIKKKKRGGQSGNKNAVGAGAPLRNTNAQTHGAYSTVYLDQLPEEQKQQLAEIDSMTTAEKLSFELQLLYAKEFDLTEKLKQYEIIVDDGEVIESTYIDKIVTSESSNGHSETYIKVSGFERRAKLETQLSRVHGRILRLLDSIKAHENEQKRFALDEKKYNLMRQKITGQFTLEVDDETGEIVDDLDDDDNSE